MSPYSSLVSTLFLGTHGGDEEDRTPDPLLARQVLSQLSYTPMVYRVPLSSTLGLTDFSSDPENRTTISLRLTLLVL